MKSWKDIVRDGMNQYLNMGEHFIRDDETRQILKCLPGWLEKNAEHMDMISTYTNGWNECRSQFIHNVLSKPERKMYEKYLKKLAKTPAPTKD